MCCDERFVCLCTDVIESNLLKAKPNLSQDEIKRISKEMWSNYGRILAEYIFIKKIRNSKNNDNFKH